MFTYDYFWEWTHDGQQRLDSSVFCHVECTCMMFFLSDEAIEDILTTVDSK